MPYGSNGNIKRHFTLKSLDTVTVSTNSLVPSTFPALSVLDQSGQFSVDVATNSIKNDGDAVGELIGTISFQPTGTGGSYVDLTLWSEMSMDGVTWVPLEESLRTIAVKGNQDSYVTIASRGNEFPAGAYVRWQMFASAALSIQAPTQHTAAGGAVGGTSVLWELSEV